MPTKKTSRKQAKKKTTVTPRTFVNIILDESGSMWALKNTTIAGVNTYLDGLRDQKKVFVTLTKFNTLKNVLYAMEKGKTAPALNALNYLPAGGTALYDAIGASVKAVSGMDKKTDRVLNLIVTDGQENSSKEFSKADCKTLITSLEAQGNWTFTFLGANLDAAKEADSLGIVFGNTMQYQATDIGTRSAFQAMTASSGTYLNSVDTQTKSFYSAPTPEEAKIFSGKPRKRIIP